MAKRKKAEEGEYEVGFGKPPQEHQFKKGRSGNPAGRPKKKGQPVDVAAILNEPLLVRNSGVRRKMQSYEISVRKLVERALKHNDLNAILAFLQLCETYRVLVPPPDDEGGGVIHAPRGVSVQQWLDSVTELVPRSTHKV